MARPNALAFIKTVAVTVSAVLFLSTVASSADITSPLVGTWVLNVAKSTFDPPPPLKSHQVTSTLAPGGGLHTSLDIVEADGTKVHAEYTSALDGKAVPLIGYPDADSIIVTQVNDRTIKNVLLKAGKVAETGTFTVSKSGKTMSGTIAGTDAGVAWKYHYVFDRQ